MRALVVGASNQAVPMTATRTRWSIAGGQQGHITGPSVS